MLPFGPTCQHVYSFSMVFSHLQATNPLVHPRLFLPNHPKSQRNPFFPVQISQVFQFFPIQIPKNLSKIQIPKKHPKINGKPYVLAVFLHIQLKKTSTDNPPKRSPRRITGALVKDRWLIQLQQLFAEMDASRIRKELITATEMAALIQAASTNGALVGKLGVETHRKAGGKWRLI